MYTTRLNPLWASLLTFGAACAISTPALAAGPITVTIGANGAKTARIYHGDLNLASYEGQRSLDKRVLLAVSRVCQMPNESFSVEQACRRATYREAKPLVLAAIERRNTQLAMVSAR